MIRGATVAIPIGHVSFARMSGHPHPERRRGSPSLGVVRLQERGGSNRASGRAKTAKRLSPSPGGHTPSGLTRASTRESGDVQARLPTRLHVPRPILGVVEQSGALGLLLNVAVLRNTRSMDAGWRSSSARRCFSRHCPDTWRPRQSARGSRRWLPVAAPPCRSHPQAPRQAG
jgi:hypothetical protein